MDENSIVLKFKDGIYVWEEIQNMDNNTLAVVSSGKDGQILSVLNNQLSWVSTIPISRIADPVYLNSTQYKINYCYVRNSANTKNIIVGTPTILDITKTYITPLLVGTVSCNGSNVTGVGTQFTKDFIVGDIITFTGIVNAKILSILSDTEMTVNISTKVSSVGYKRGGRHKNTHYYIYATNAGYILSTRSEYNGDLIDFPSSEYKQLPHALTTDGNGNLLHVAFTGTTASIIYPVLSAPNFNYMTLTPLSLANFIPRTSRTANLIAKLFNKATLNSLSISHDGVNTATYFQNTNAPGTFYMNINTSMTDSIVHVALLSDANGSAANLTVNCYFLPSML